MRRRIVTLLSLKAAEEKKRYCTLRLETNHIKTQRKASSTIGDIESEIRLKDKEEDRILLSSSHRHILTEDERLEKLEQRIADSTKYFVQVFFIIPVIDYVLFALLGKISFMVTSYCLLFATIFAAIAVERNRTLAIKTLLFMSVLKMIVQCIMAFSLCNLDERRLYICHHFCFM